MTGTIAKILEAQTFASGFTKREFVLTSEDDYPQSVKFECVKERCALLDAVQPGERIKVAFRIRGNEYKERYYVNLQAYQIERLDADGGTRTVENDAIPEDGPGDVSPF